MKEIPILFSTPMVRAILDGTKTQTRQVIKPQPEYAFGDGRREVYKWKDGLFSLKFYPDRTIILDYCPYGKPGDILCVRETFTLTQYGKHVYKADCRDKDGYYWSSVAADINGVKWRPSIHMPRKAARIFLEVKSVRVERLQDISQEDIYAEGIQIDCVSSYANRFSFIKLWDTLNAKRGYSWESNPWVWVIEFARVK